MKNLFLVTLLFTTFTLHSSVNFIFDEIIFSSDGINNMEGNPMTWGSGTITTVSTNEVYGIIGLNQTEGYWGEANSQEWWDNVNPSNTTFINGASINSLTKQSNFTANSGFGISGMIPYEINSEGNLTFRFHAGDEMWFNFSAGSYSIAASGISNDWTVSIANSGNTIFSHNFNAIYGAQGRPDWSYIDTAVITFVSAAVPEPSTYALILGGLVLGFVAYRRK